MNKIKSNKTSPVAVIRCTSYTTDEVTSAIRQGIDLLGGPSAFAQPNEQLLFKPNVLWGTNPAKCVVTHPQVLRAAVAAFVSSGAHMVYGDSPAGLQKTKSAMKKSGYPNVLIDLPVTMVPFTTGTKISYPKGQIAKQLEIADAVLNVDGIINCAKLKTHGLVRLTAAVKNLYGCIPREAKGRYHALYPDVYDFATLLADIAACLVPRLHILDAIEAMEGNGPQSGNPKKLGVLLLSRDPVALDAVACRLIGLDPACVPTIAAGEKSGIGCGDYQHISLCGDSITPLIDTTFDVVRRPPAHIVQGTLRGTIKRMFLPRPVLNRTRCTRCGRCVSICPLKKPALTQVSSQRYPQYDYSICIRCYCCQEVCPSGAIGIHTPLFARLLPYCNYLSLLITRIKHRIHKS